MWNQEIVVCFIKFRFREKGDIEFFTVNEIKVNARGIVAIIYTFIGKTFFQDSHQGLEKNMLGRVIRDRYNNLVCHFRPMLMGRARTFL